MIDYNPFSLQNKTLLITGASSGIGRSVAIECSRMGAMVYIVGRNKERLENTYKELYGDGHVLLLADITNIEALNHVIASLPELSGVVHCAGITKLMPFQYVTKENLDTVFNVNFYAPVELSRLLIKNKKIAKRSSIVFISSISGIYCSAIASSIYSASKSALNGMVKGMALDLAPKNIRVNCVTPGVVDTDFFKESGLTQEDLERELKHYPLRRYGEPEEIAYAAIYLLSDASQWVTGSNLLIDGGFTLL